MHVYVCEQLAHNRYMRVDRSHVEIQGGIFPASRKRGVEKTPKFIRYKWEIQKSDRIKRKSVYKPSKHIRHQKMFIRDGRPPAPRPLRLRPRLFIRAFSPAMWLPRHRSDCAQYGALSPTSQRPGRDPARYPTAVATVRNGRFLSFVKVEDAVRINDMWCCSDTRKTEAN